jgi:hypothetical protein
MIFFQKRFAEVNFSCIFATAKQMVVVAQLVRASVCGTEGRGFEPRLPPRKQKP